MLIEFCCPVCRASLAIQKKTVGGQVNCPKCQKLILLPETSPLQRPDDDTPPFSPEVSYPAESVAKAIGISVEPYRRDLENKSGLLNDAVEMIKTRNERIKEIETLILNTQKDLWALEVEYDERNEDYKKAQSHLHDLREKMREEGGAKSDDTAHAAEIESELARVRTRLSQLEGECETLRSKKDLLKSRLANMIEHAENLDARVRKYQRLLEPGGDIAGVVDALAKTLTWQCDIAGAGNADLDKARDLLAAATEKLEALNRRNGDLERQRKEMEELVSSSSQDMQHAVDERNQWKKHAGELERELESARKTATAASEANSDLEKQQREKIFSLEVQLDESRKHLETWEQRRTEWETVRNDLEENLRLLHERLDTQKAEHEARFEEREKQWTVDARKRETELAGQLEEARAELKETRHQLEEALRAQEGLAEQGRQGEEKRRELKRKLEEMLDQVESLENS